MKNDTIMIDGVRYHADRPRSCRACYFWKNRKAGCTLGRENCYYLAVPGRVSEKEKPLRRMLLRPLCQLLHEEDPGV